MLQRLTRPSHVHRIGQVSPADAGVVHLSGQTLVSLEANRAGDVVVLGGAAGGVHENHALITHVGGIEGSGEELVVRTVDGVAALEGHHVLTLGQVRADLSGRLAREDALGQLQPLNRTAQVEATAFGGDHLHRRVFQGGGAVAANRLAGLVRFPLALHRHHGQLLTAVGQQQLLTNGDVVAIGIHHDRQTKEKAAGGAVLLDHREVVVLVHEAAQG